MCVFRNLTRCTNTKKLAFGRVIYVWQYPFVMYNHQAGVTCKYLFLRHVFHISRQFSFIFNFCLLTISAQFERLSSYNLFSEKYSFFFEREREKERKRDLMGFQSAYHPKL